MESSTQAKTAGYVLAGGASNRFGSDKALVRFGSTPLLKRIIQLLEKCTTSVSVVAAQGKYSELNVKIVEDRWPGEGPLGGIITALQHTAATNPQCELNLILSCDMPFVTSEWLQFLVGRAQVSKAQVVLPYSAHGPEPLCACYRTDAAGPLQTVFESGVRKVTQALKQLRAEVLDEAVWKRFDSAGRLFWNMNTPADFVEAQRMWELEQGAQSEGRIASGLKSAVEDLER